MRLRLCYGSWKSWISYLSFLFFLLIINACQDQLSDCPEGQNSSSVSQLATPKLADNRYNVAFLVMDGVFNSELTAPYDIFHHSIFRGDSIKAMNVFMVANESKPVTTFEGMQILPHFNYLTDSLPPIDILVVPSAEHHLDTDLQDSLMLDFVRRAAAQAQFVLSLCDGAFVLAEAGLLDGYKSTTFPGDIATFRKRYPELEVLDSVIFVHDGKFITSAGGARSFEPALYLSELLYGRAAARETAKGMVIDWDLQQIPHYRKILDARQETQDPVE